MQPLTTAPTRTEQVYAAIRDSICDCTLSPGTHLVQEELAGALGVSRQPVQQALLLLKSDGLVVELGARGLHVAPLDPAEMAHRYQIRTVLDRLAARLVAARVAAGEEDVLACLRGEGEAILAAGDGALQRGSTTEAVRHDVAFHSLIYRMSGNPLIAPAAEPHWHFLRRVMIGVVRHVDRGALVWREHRDILAALVTGDADEAERLVREHVSGAEAALQLTLAAGQARPTPGDRQLAGRSDRPED